MMRNVEVDVQTVRQIARLAGLELPADRASELVPALKAMLEADGRVVALGIERLPATGLPWLNEEATPRDQ
jgi:hypothetical protein